MFDFSKAASAVADLDSRLEQLTNQQKITNGLLALLILCQPSERIAEVLTEHEVVTLNTMAQQYIKRDV